MWFNPTFFSLILLPFSIWFHQQIKIKHFFAYPFIVKNAIWNKFQHLIHIHGIDFPVKNNNKNDNNKNTVTFALDQQRKNCAVTFDQTEMKKCIGIRFKQKQNSKCDPMSSILAQTETKKNLFFPLTFRWCVAHLFQWHNIRGNAMIASLQRSSVWNVNTQAIYEMRVHMMHKIMSAPIYDMSNNTCPKLSIICKNKIAKRRNKKWCTNENFNLK